MAATPSQALVNSLAAALAVEVPEGPLMELAHFMRLFSNDVAPSHGMDSGTFVFGSQSLAGLGATSITANSLVITPGSFAFKGIPTLVNDGLFVGTATVGYPCTIYGYVAVGSDSITPIYAERLPAPVTLTGEGQGLQINPSLGWSNSFIG